MPGKNCCYRYVNRDNSVLSCFFNNVQIKANSMSEPGQGISFLKELKETGRVHLPVTV